MGGDQLARHVRLADTEQDGHALRRLERQVEASDGRERPNTLANCRCVVMYTPPTCGGHAADTRDGGMAERKRPATDWAA